VLSGSCAIERVQCRKNGGAMMVSPMLQRPVTMKAFGITDKGRVRSNNEDQFLIAELTKSMRIFQTSLTEPKLQVGEERAHLFLVADGMGGHRAGERASALAVVAIEQFTLNTFKWFFGTDSTQTQKVLAQFQSALSQADVRILEEAVEHPELSGMETTVTMALHLDTSTTVLERAATLATTAHWCLQSGVRNGHTSFEGCTLVP
jgi:serine/threonine protein phosphatase PrpC